MRTGELECFHGQGHSAGVHGCDGCCTKLFDHLLDSIKADAWEEGWKDSLALAHFADNPYRIIISPNDYDQLRKALEDPDNANV